MADVFKDPPMAALGRSRSLICMVVRTKVEIPIPNVGFKHFNTTDLLCANKLLVPTVSKALSPVVHTEYRRKRLVEVTTASN